MLFTQPKPLYFPCLCFWQFIHELAGAWVFIGGQHCFYMVFKKLNLCLPSLEALIQNYICFNDLTPFFIVSANNGTFGHALMTQHL